MKLRGIEFGPCVEASGVRGWYGEGYWFHHLAPWWFNFEGSTRVAKTTTLNPHKGNMPIHGSGKKFAPKEWLPACIYVNPFTAETINSVGLAGPGALALLETGLLSDPDNKPFMISFMSVAATPEARIKECAEFCALLKQNIHLGIHGKRLALQINISCPNTGLDPHHLIHEAHAMLDIADSLNIPIMVKVNIFAPTEALVAIASHEACDGICTTNAIPFGSALPHMDWGAHFKQGSPLERASKTFGKGGYSGNLLLDAVADQIRNAKDAGVTKPWNAGGGIRSAIDVSYLCVKACLEPHKDSIFFASLAMTRPWRIQSVIRKAHQLLA